MSENLSRIMRRLAAIGLLLAAVASSPRCWCCRLRLISANCAPTSHASATCWRGSRPSRRTRGQPRIWRGARKPRCRAAYSSAGETDALRTANLQALITDIAVKHGVRLSSARALPAQERDGLRFIGVQAELDADMPQLQAIMLAFEAQRPYLFIQSLQVAPVSWPPPGQRRPQGPFRHRRGGGGRRRKTMMRAAPKYERSRLRAAADRRRRSRHGAAELAPADDGYRHFARRRAVTPPTPRFSPRPIGCRARRARPRR